MDQRGRGSIKLIKANNNKDYSSCSSSYNYEYDAEKYHDSLSSSSNKHLFMKIVFLLVMVVLSCYVLGQSTYPTQFFQMPYLFLGPKNESAPLLIADNVSSLSNDSTLVKPSMFHQFVENLPSTTTGNEDLALDEVLKRAAMPDKTVMIVTLNEAWTEPNSIFDMFLESIRIGNQTLQLLKHLVVVALDHKAFDHCLALHLNCYYLTVHGADFSREAGFMTPSYIKMSWEKIDFLRIVLEKGYSFLYTDADVMWFRNPFPQFYSEGDFQISTDNFNGNHLDLDNAPNTGLKYVKSTKQTIEFYKFWYNTRPKYSQKNDQFAFNKIKHDPFVRKIGLQIKFLDTAYFGGFCQPSKNLNMMCSMHANCCGSLEVKLRGLKTVIEDWRKYISLDENVRKSNPPAWSVNFANLIKFQ